MGQHERGIRTENLEEIYRREISDRLPGYIVRPPGKLPLSQEKDIAIQIFPERDYFWENSYRAATPDRGMKRNRLESRKELSGIKNI
jgi:hypothetical protein